MVLGASLDAIITDINISERWGVEIKCPSAKFNQPLQDVLKDSFYLRKKRWKYLFKRKP